jgi:hypothetical protein
MQDIATAKPCSGQSEAAMVGLAKAKDNGTLQSSTRWSACSLFMTISFYRLLPLTGDFIHHSRAFLGVTGAIGRV